MRPDVPLKIQVRLHEIETRGSFLNFELKRGNRLEFYDFVDKLTTNSLKMPQICENPPIYRTSEVFGFNEAYTKHTFPTQSLMGLLGAPKLKQIRYFDYSGGITNVKIMTEDGLESESIGRDY